ncbi:unnamed protein product [Amoebophrya sp. A25]|nr:unnamed protein product [Amoebophrya sp. A25]|eukprot:GSA25T00001801001.1
MGTTTTYLPGLAWVGGRLEKNVAVTVCNTSGKILKVTQEKQPKVNGNIGPDGDKVQLPNAILLPGFVNCHSHAFQRGLRGKGEEGDGDFWTWRQQMHRLVTTLNDEDFEAHCTQCFTEMRDAGVTTVGEFHYFHHGEKDALHKYDEIILRAAATAGIRIVLLSAFYARGGVEIPELNAGQQRFRTPGVDKFIESLVAADRVCAQNNKSAGIEKLQTVGVVAHSIRALTVEDLGLLVKHAQTEQRVFHMHVEEQRAEIEQCLKGNKGCTPLRCLLDAGVPDMSNCTLVHCTHSNEKDMRDYMEGRGGNVCVCPLTEGSLADGLPRWLVRKDQVVVGSDSNLRIDLLEEARWLEYGQRLWTERRGHFSVVDLVNVLTVNGARSMGLPIGRISEGCYGDFTMIDMRAPVLQNIDTLKAEEFLAAALYAAAGSEVICGTAVGGRWRPRPIFLPRALVPDGLTVMPSTATSTGFGGHRDRGPFGSGWNCDLCWRREDLSTQTEICAPVSSGPAGSVTSASGNGAAVEKPLPAAFLALLKQASPDVLALARVLIDIDSVSGTEIPMARALETWFQAHGYEVQLQPVEPETGKQGLGSRFNVLAWPKGTQPSSLPLLFNTHLDVVPPFFPSGLKPDPLDPSKQILTGRGSCDTKSLLAAMLLAVQSPMLAALKEKIGFIFVVSEETTHQGMKRANALNLQPKFLIVGEPTAARVMRFQKGILKLRITCRGVAAHSGYPHLGVSAVGLLLDVLERIRKAPYPRDDLIGETDLNVGFIEGGQAINALAEHASAMLMFRLVSEPKVVHDIVSAILRELNESVKFDKGKKGVEDRIYLELITQNAPVDLTHVDKFLDKSRWNFGTACFNTDIPYFKSSVGTKSFLYGHGDICDAHCPREYIGVDDLRSCVGAYARMAKELLESGSGASKLSNEVAQPPAAKRVKR